MKHIKTLSILLISLFFSYSNTLDIYGQNNLNKNTKSDPNTPIFEIKNDLNQTVFAVYPGGVRIFVDDQLKAAGGGFTVGRLSTGKAGAGDIFSVVPNNVNVYIDDATGVKAAGGGFTVGRLSTGKAAGEPENFLSVTPDSTRVYIKETSPYGFSVGKLGALNNTNFLNLTTDNYFIGHDVAPGITSGLRNSVFGYNAGFSLQGGDDNIFIGNQAGYNAGVGSIGGNENVFVGNKAGFNSTTPVRNVFVGHEAGYGNVTGQYNTFVGNAAGRNGTGGGNTVIGGLAASTNDFGGSNVVIGYVAGRDMVSDQNVYIGTGAGYNNSGAVGGNIFIGYYAGETLGGEDHRLAIANNRSTPPLIYGEFDTQNVTVTGNLYATGELASTSDIRLKTNLVKFTSGLEIIKSLNTYYFDWNKLAKKTYSYPDKKQIGLIAQEVEKLVPEIISTSTNGYLAIDYGKMAPVLVNAIKEQQIIIDKLENRISELEKKNESLTSKVDGFQSMKSEINELKVMMKEVLVNKQALNSTAEVQK